MIGFNQTYHYIVDCPLRKLNKDPLPDSPLAHWFERYTLDLFLESFLRREFTESMTAFGKRIDDLEKMERVQDIGAKLKMYQKGILNTQVFAAERDETTAESIGEFEASPMHGMVHISRMKPNRTVELIWFNFEPVRPDMQTQDILSLYTQWNARAYEVAFKRRPYQLTIYYPLIGISIPFIYNTLNRLDVVAEMIEMGVYFTKPDRERCMSCRACPEFVRMDNNGCLGGYLL